MKIDEVPQFLTERLGECGIQHSDMATATQQRARYCLAVRPCPLKNRDIKRHQFKPEHLALSRLQETLTRSGCLDLLKNEPD